MAHTPGVRERDRELEAAASAAEDARNRLEGVLSALEAGVLILDSECRIRLANPAAGRLIGVPPDSLVGQDAAAVLGEVERGGDGEVTRPGVPDPRVLRISRRNLVGGGDAEVALLRDVTERSRQTEENERLEKLDELLRSLGTLTHKINNPLTALIGRAQLLGARTQTDPRTAKSVAVIEESAGRITELVRELGRFVEQARQDLLGGPLKVEDDARDLERE